MKIFFDVDNTILEHSSFYSIATEGRVHSSIGKYPIDNNDAIRTMYESSICRNPDLLRELIKLDNVYILTKFPAPEYEEYKQLRLANILQITVEELLSMTDSNGQKKYVCLHDSDSKVEVVKKMFNHADLTDCVLVDDYSNNLLEWENNKGIGIKYFNEYNSANHPTSGLSISNFEIFKFMVHQNSIEDLLLSSLNPFSLKLFLNEFMRYRPSSKIDLFERVYCDLMQQLDINQLKVNTKYDINNFITEYYLFQQNLNPQYWINVFKQEHESLTDFTVAYATFDIDFKKLKLFNHKNYLSMCIIDSNHKTKRIHDVYLTLNEHLFVDSIGRTIIHMSKFLNMLLFNQ